MERTERTALRTAIFHSGIRQVALAKKADISEARLSKIANGYLEATPEEKRRIARTLRCSVDELFPESIAS